MNINEDHIDLIEKYLDGELNAEERTVFEKKLNEDRDFANLYILRKSLPRILDDANEYDKAKEEISQLIRENEKQTSKFIRSPYFYAIAAGLIILFGTFMIFFVINKTEKEPMSAENKTGENDSLVILKPEIQQKKTKIKKYEEEKTKTLQIKPGDGSVFRLDDEIIFKWDYKNDSITHLYIFSILTDNLMHKMELKAGTDSLKITAKKLGAGEYYWYIGEKKNKQSFSIKK